MLSHRGNLAHIKNPIPKCTSSYMFTPSIKISIHYLRWFGQYTGYGRPAENQ